MNVPKLCATDSLEPFGSCRLCLVESRGGRLSRLLHDAVEPGMKVNTQSPKLAAAQWRDGAVHLRPSAGLPDLCRQRQLRAADMAGVVGLREVRYGYDGENHFHSEKDESNPYFTYDPVQMHRLQPLRARLRGNPGHVCADHLRPRLRFARIAGTGPAFMDSECVSCGACVEAARPRR